LHRTARRGVTDSIGDEVVVEAAGLADVQLGRSAHLIAVTEEGVRIPFTTSPVVDFPVTRPDRSAI
jgi:hypothetical protein